MTHRRRLLASLAWLAGACAIALVTAPASAWAAMQGPTTAPPQTSPSISAGAVAKLAQAHGQADGKASAWLVTTQAPPGWTDDCCMVAGLVGADLALYRGTWNGKPEGVMVLNVWPSTLPTLADEWADDQRRYLARDAKAHIDTLTPAPSGPLACHLFAYHGSDHIDDVLAFCQPPASAGIRLSWSMALAVDDPDYASLLAQFRQVVGASRYAPYRAAPNAAPAAR